MADIKHKLGDIICREEGPFVQVIFEDVKGKACDNCAFDMPNLKKCSGCKHMWYCSEECQKKDWKFAHKYECGSVYKNHYDEMFSPNIRILLRLYNVLQNNKGLASRKINDVIGKSFNDLPSNKEKIEKDARAMREFANICDSFNKCKFEFDVPAMFEYFCKVRVNTSYFVNSYRDGNSFVLYITSNCFKHSCVPNALVLAFGTQMDVKALRDIKADEEVFISFIELNQTREERQQDLKKKFMGECACPRCTSDFDKEFDYKRLAKLMKEREKYDNVKKTKAVVVIPANRLYDIEKEIVSCYEKIYGKYHPRVTEALMIMAKNLFCMRKLGYKTENFDQFAIETFEHFKITHGAPDEFFEPWLETLADDAKAAFGPFNI